jgi:hypothetical protein
MNDTHYNNKHPRTICNIVLFIPSSFCSPSYSPSLKSINQFVATAEFGLKSFIEVLIQKEKELVGVR